jgi:hypothetical protein
MQTKIVLGGVLFPPCPAPIYLAPQQAYIVFSRRLREGAGTSRRASP